MPRARHRLAICIDNRGYEASLERRKIYELVPDVAAGRRALVRVIDETGEDYLYPGSLFVGVTLPPAVRRALLQAA
jgi:hypothetical protein